MRYRLLATKADRSINTGNNWKGCWEVSYIRRPGIPGSIKKSVFRGYAEETKRVLSQRIHQEDVMYEIQTRYGQMGSDTLEGLRIQYQYSQEEMTPSEAKCLTIMFIQKGKHTHRIKRLRGITFVTTDFTRTEESESI